MSSHFDGKVITVTGAASGIGRATAMLLASRGAKVSAIDVQEELLRQTIQDIENEGGVAFGTVVDIRDRSQVEKWISTTVERYGKLDGAANIAGVTGKDLGNADLHAIDDNDFAFVFDVNVKGTLNCMRAQVQNMKDSSSIVNVSSLAGVTGAVRHYAYNASKHAVNGLSKCAAKELASRKIRVNVVAPGAVDTPMIQAAEKVKGDYAVDLVPLKRKGQPIELAEAIAWYLCDGSSYVTCSVLNVDGGWLYS